MKRITLIAAILMAMGCKEKEPFQPCNCGEVTNNGKNTSGNYITVKNQCTSNDVNFYMTWEQVQYYKIGDKYCTDVVDSW